MAQVMDLEELCLTPKPFYIHAAFLRLNCHGGCDGCMFNPEEDDWEEDMKEGRVCPDNLWWYVMQRQKVTRKFDASHPPICPHCKKKMVADGTVTSGDEDVAAFTCNHCHKIDRSSRYYVEWDRRMLKNNPAFFAKLNNDNKTSAKGVVKQ